MIRVIVFDFDGTLVNSNHIKEGCLRQAVRDILGGQAALAEARQGGGDRYRIFAEVARGLADSPEDVMVLSRRLVSRYSQCCERGIAAAVERRGARRALSLLRQRKLSLWIVSATPTRDLLPLLRRRGLLRLLDGAIGAPGAKGQCVRTILRRKRRMPHEVLVVGDGADDLAAARAVGALFVAITASGKVGGRHGFAMNDLTKLVPLIDRLTPRPVSCAR